MAYRTRLNGVQIFGDNDYFLEWEEFINSEGIEIDDDGCYEGYITDLQGLFNVIDTITRNLIKDRHQKVLNGETWHDKPFKELTDLSESDWITDNSPLLWINQQAVKHAYCFLPLQVFEAVKDLIEETGDCNPKNRSKCKFFYHYSLKEGIKIPVLAS